jgi:tyrosine-protein phosphatase SIW14
LLENTRKSAIRNPQSEFEEALMSRYTPLFVGTFIIALLVGGPVWYAFYREGQVKNFREVREGVLYRSGQMTVVGLRSVVHDFGIKTVITLRDAVYAGDRPPDQAEEDYCDGQCIKYVRISPRTWWAPDGSVPAEEGVRRFREVMDDSANYPVLIHCFGGIHRTGAFCAVYRMEYEKWTNSEAIAEMRRCGYKDLEDEWDLLTFLETYEPRWKRQATSTEAP